MSYYNTQTNPQQNPQNQQQQAQSQFGSQPQQQSGGSGSFQNWMKPQKQRTAQQAQSGTQQQPQQQQQGWQPTSAVTPNGQINRTPITFQSAPQPTPISSVGQAKQQAPQTAQQAHQYITNGFQQVHGRPPSQQELDNWGAALIHGGQTPEMMMNNISQLPGAQQQFNPLNVPGNVGYQQQNFAPNLYDVNAPREYQFNPNNISQYSQQGNQYATDTMQQWQNLQQQPLGLPVEQMKAQQAEIQNQLFQQNAGSMMQNAAAAGRVTGGNAQRMQQMANADRSQNIMRAYRDIDIEDALSRRQNIQGMTELGNTLANNQQGRDIADYDTALKGQTVREGFSKDAASLGQNSDIAFQDFLSRQYGDALSGAGFNESNNQFGAEINRGIWNDQQGAYQQNRAQNLQDFVANSGINLDWNKFGQDQSQDRFNNIFDIMDFLEGQRQFNVGTDLDRSKLGVTKGNAALQAALQQRGQDINLLDFFRDG